MAFNPKVSIVIPVYNGANYLGQAIESALAQTYPNTEVLVVDDGSTDDGATAGVARSYGERIRYVNKPNGGVSSALNCGIHEMSGVYFSWLSHDDLYYPEKIERQIQHLERNRHIRVLATGFDVVADDGSVRSTYSVGDAVLRNGKAVMDHWLFGCSLLIERGVFEDVCPFNEGNRTVQDLEMWLEIVDADIPIYLIPAVLCAWRHHDASDSFRHRTAHFAEVERFFAWLLSTYPLEFFSDEPGPLSPCERSQVFDWLGEQARHRGAAATARRMFVRAVLARRNMLEPSFWRALRKACSHWKHHLLSNRPEMV